MILSFECCRRPGNESPPIPELPSSKPEMAGTAPSSDSRTATGTMGVGRSGKWWSSCAGKQKSNHRRHRGHSQSQNYLHRNRRWRALRLHRTAGRRRVRWALGGAGSGGVRARENKNLTTDDTEVTANPRITFIETGDGGHCAFIGQPDGDGYDGRWAEREGGELVRGKTKTQPKT